MSVVNGNAVGLYNDNQLIGCLTNTTFNGNNEEIVTTCKDNNGARQVIPGGQTADIAFAGNYDPASGYGFEDLVLVWKNKTRVGVKQGIDGGFYIAGYGYLNTLSWEGPLNAASTFSGTFTFDGPVITGTET
jgi:hypothetical protein